MARPPEPLEEVLPLATVIIEGKVGDVVSTDEPEPEPPHEWGASDVGIKAPRQVVILKVREVLRGDVAVGDEIEVTKPSAPYALRIGNFGPFLLDEAQNILGAYGPDTYSLESLRRACSE